MIGGNRPRKEDRCVEFTDFVACSVDFFEKVEGVCHVFVLLFVNA